MKPHVFSFVLLFFVILNLLPAAALAIEPGAPAPGFTLPNLQGQDVSLADFKGRLVLVKLATTWCPTCKELSAEIDRIGAFLKEQNVAVLEVFVQDTQTMVRAYLGDAVPPMTFHALLDDGQVYKAYGVYLIPRLLLVDAGQIVRYDSAGRSLRAEDIRELVLAFNPPAEGTSRPL